MLDDQLQRLSELVWWPTTLLLLFGIGIYLTIGLGTLPWRHLLEALRVARDEPPADRRRVKGEITPLQALMTTLGVELGAGSIVGVATAIQLGGPGAVFWMWATGVVGMALKYAEVVLAVRFRERGPAGEWVGGPMYYIQNGLGARWRWLAVLFAALAAIATFGIGNLVQANSFATALEASFAIDRRLAGGVGALLAGAVIIGGLRRISTYAQNVVPLASGLYISSALVVLAMSLDQIPGAMVAILDGALTGSAASGGVVGGGIWLALHYGVARATFSGGAGRGSAPIVHATARTTSPVRQGLLAASGLFINIFVLCTLTALIILVPGRPSGDLADAALPTTAFAATLWAPFQLVVPITVILFTFNCLVASSYYGEVPAQYLLGRRVRLPYRLLWVSAVFAGAVIDIDTVWVIADLMNGLMALPNLIALLLLSPLVFRLTRAHLRPARAATRVYRRAPWVRPTLRQGRRDD